MDENKLIEEIRHLTEQHPVQFPRIIGSKKNQHLQDYLSKKFPQLAGYKIQTKVYWLLFDLKNFPCCEKCGERIKKDVVFTKGYQRFCSTRCSNSSLTTQEKALATRHRKNHGQYFSVRSKAKAKMTFIRKYGVDNNMKSDEGKLRHAQAMEKKYGKGIVNPFQLESVKKKIKEAKKKKYSKKSSTSSSTLTQH